MRNRQAFTLVELIVVVTILAILATIGFVSYSGYLSGVRDTNRVASLTSMSDGLELFRTKNDLPHPDDAIDIRIEGNTIAHQGYIGKNVLQTIEYSKSGKDPKDDSYYSYYLSADKKYYQLMTFLEESDNLETYIISDSNTAINYQNRHPKVYGKRLGILTNTDNVPVQELGIGNLNFTGGTTENYIARFTDTNNISDSGGELLLLDDIISPAKNKPQSCRDLLSPKSFQKDGKYEIYINDIKTAVYCDMTTSGGGWMMLSYAEGEGTDIYNHNDIVSWTTKNSDNCSLDTECISKSGNIQDWNELMIYTRGYKVKGSNCNDKNTSIKDYSSLASLSPATTSNWLLATAGAHGKCDTLKEVSQGLIVSDLSDHNDPWPIRMGVRMRNNDGGNESVLLFFGPTFIPQGFGTHRSTTGNKIHNRYGADKEDQVNDWDGASREKQTWFIR